MRLFISVCGCADPVTDSLVTTEAPSRSGTNADSSEISKKLQEVIHFRRERNNTPLQQKYDELESVLNKCKEELTNLRGSTAATPSHLRHQYVALGADLKKCKEELQELQEEAKSMEPESLLKKYQALDYSLYKYRKGMEDELQKCWTQLKLHHLESQFASASYGKN